MVQTKKEKKPVGRPPRPFSEPIDMTPEELAEKVLSMPFKKDWRFTEKDEKGRR